MGSDQKVEHPQNPPALVERFFGVGGADVCELERNFGVFMAQSIVTPEFIDLIGQLPKSLLQEQWLAKMTALFGNERQILALLASQDVAQCQGTFRFLSLDFLQYKEPAEVVDQVLPGLSSYIRHKLLSRLLARADGTKAQHYFTLLDAKYGFKIASIALPYCELETVRKVVQEREVPLPFQLQHKICERHPGFIDVLYDIALHYRLEGQPLKFNIAHYLSNQEKYAMAPKGFHILEMLKFKLLGKKSTKEVVRALTEDVVKNAQRFNFLKQHSVRRVLSEEQFVTYCANLLPKLFKDCSEHTIPLGAVKDLSPTKKLDILSRAFKQAYGKDIVHCKDIARHIAPHMPLEFRERVCKSENPLQYPPELLQLLDADEVGRIVRETAPLKKEMYERLKLVEAWIKSCKMCNNDSALVGALEYIVTRHKNEIPSFHRDVLSSIKNTYPVDVLIEGRRVGFLKTTQEVWPHIETLLMRMVRNSSDAEKEYWDYENMIELFVDLIEYKMQHQLPYNELVQIYARESDKYNLFSKKIGKDLPSVRTILGMTPSLNHEKDLNHLSEVVEYNRRARKYKEQEIDIVSEFPHLLKRLSKAIKEGDPYDHLYFAIVKTAPIPQLTEKFWTHRICDGRHRDYNEFFFELLRHNPEEMTRRADQIVKSGCMLGKKFVRHCKMYGPTNLSQRLDELFDGVLQGFQEADDAAPICAALEWFSIDDNFSARLQHFVPDESAQKISSPTLMEDVHRNLRSLFKSARKPRLLLPIIIEFMRDDTLKYALPGCIHVAHQLPEQDVLELATILWTKAVSVRKHALTIAIDLMSSKNAQKILTTAIATEKNASVLLYLRSALFNFFVDSPSEDSLHYIVEQISSLKAIDETFEHMLEKYNKIPLTYLTRFMVTVWEASKDLGLPAHDKIIMFLGSREMVSLPEVLLDEMAATKLKIIVSALKDGKDVGSFAFYIMYIFHSSSTEEYSLRLKRLKTIFDQFYAEAAEDIFAQGKRMAAILSMIDGICKETNSSSCTYATNIFVRLPGFRLQFRSMLKELLAFWHALDLGTQEKYDGVVRITNAVLLNKFLIDNDMNSFARKLVTQFEDAVAEYGLIIVPRHIACLKEILSADIFCENDASGHNPNTVLYRILHIMIDAAGNLPDSLKILIIGLLPSTRPQSTGDEYTLFDNLIKRVSRGGKAVTYFMCEYMRNVKINN